MNILICINSFLFKPHSKVLIEKLRHSFGSLVVILVGKQRIPKTDALVWVLSSNQSQRYDTT